MLPYQPDMEINVTVQDATLASIVHEATDYSSSVRVADLLVTEALKKLTADRDGWGSLTARVNQIRDEEIRAVVAPVVTEALTLPFRATNMFGEPIGPEISLRELIIKEARSLLTKQADHSSRSSQTVIGKLVQDTVRAVFAKELTAEVARAKESVSTEIGTMLADTVKQAMRSR